jgi:hypothetical protein
MPEDCAPALSSKIEGEIGFALAGIKHKKLRHKENQAWTR